MKHVAMAGVWAVLVAVCSVGCTPTSFEGDAKVADGPRGCWNKCRAWGLEFAGMVSMGEYSDGCICRVPTRTGAADMVDGAAGSLAAAAGVMTAMRAREAQARNQMITTTPH